MMRELRGTASMPVVSVVTGIRFVIGLKINRLVSASDCLVTRRRGGSAIQSQDPKRHKLRGFKVARAIARFPRPVVIGDFRLGGTDGVIRLRLAGRARTLPSWLHAESASLLSTIGAC